MSPHEATPPPEEPEVTTDLGSWKRNTTGKPVAVPSGNTALIKRKPMEAFWRAGMIPNSLTQIVMKAMARGGRGPAAGTSDDFTEEQLRDLLGLADLVVVECVLEPKVYAAPENGDARDPSKLYVDEIDFDDKMFIYNYALGVVDELQSFRREQATDVGDVPDGEAVEDETEPAARDS